MKKTLVATVVMPALVALLACSGCKKKDDDVAPMPPPPPPTSAPTPVLIAPEEDAAVDAPDDVEPDVKKVTGAAKPPDVAGLRACCNALQQNAASMPPPNNAYALQGAAICQSMVAAMAAGTQSKAGALAVIGGALRGAGLPPACH